MSGDPQIYLSLSLSVFFSVKCGQDKRETILGFTTHPHEIVNIVVDIANPFTVN